MATIWPHGKRVAVRFSIDGRRLVTTLPFKPNKTGLAAAQRAANDAEHRLKAGESWSSVRAALRCESPSKAIKTLGYYAQSFLDHVTVQRSTLMSYQAIYAKYWHAFDGFPIDELLLTELRDHMAAFKVSAKTRNNAVSVLRQIVDLAVRDRVISESPVAHWDVKKGQAPEPDPYTEVERDKLLEALQPWPIAWRYFLTAFHSGMRTGEMLGLEWRSLSKPYAMIEQSRVRRRIKPGTKTGKNRKIILPPIVWDALDSNPTRFMRSFVFLTPENLPFIDADWLMERWLRAHQSAGVRRRVGPYPWRHTYVSLALSNGAAPLWVSKQTGHDMVTMSKHYARWISGREAEDQRELEKVYKRVNKKD